MAVIDQLYIELSRVVTVMTPREVQMRKQLKRIKTVATIKNKRWTPVQRLNWIAGFLSDEVND
jgi:hypothetical protein